jgi:hypothetical protein
MGFSLHNLSMPERLKASLQWKRSTQKGASPKAAREEKSSTSPIVRQELERKQSKRPSFGGRPQAPQRIPSVQTQYMAMLLSQDSIPRLDNILAASFQWILLAGFLVLPATFKSIQSSERIQSSSQNGNVASAAALAAVSNAPLLYVGSFCLGFGLLGKAWLAFRHRGNYVWLVNKIFMPGAMNSSAGLISTVVNIYSAQHGDISITAKITLWVTGACTGLFLFLFALFNFLVLKRVKVRHDRELQRDLERGSRAEEQNEGTVEKAKRLARQPGLEPSSVI